MLNSRTIGQLRDGTLLIHFFSNSNFYGISFTNRKAPIIKKDITSLLKTRLMTEPEEDSESTLCCHVSLKC